MLDLHVGSELSDAAFEEECDLWTEGLVERDCWKKGPAAVTKSGKPARKASTLINKPRSSAYVTAKALDHMLQLVLGCGLVRFVYDPAARWVDRALPVLVLHGDEASPNLSMACWLMYKAKVRCIWMRDIYHRAWNDVSITLRRAGLWWVVLLGRVVFNLPYGPWDGCAFWENYSPRAVT